MTERPRILALLGGVVLFGQERGNIEALAALKDEGCEVLCLISDAPWNTDIPRALDERGLRWLKVPYVQFRIRGNLLNAIRQPATFVRANIAALRANRRFRATHFHSMNPSYVLNFWMLLMLFRKTPLIYRAGDEPPTVRRWRMFWKSAASRVTRFVAISEFIRTALISDGVSRGCIELIYNRPPTRIPPAGSDRLEADFVYVGQILEEKGVGLLVRAFETLAGDFPEARLLVVGRIHEVWHGDAWARRLQRDVGENGKIRDRVVFAGFREDIPHVLEGSGVLVAPSLINEALGNVVLEAKKAGIPSIVFPRGGLPELIENEVDGLVCRAADVDALVEAMRRYLDAPGLAAKHGAAARRSLERFAVDQFAKRWLSVYEATPVHQRSGAA